MSRSDSRATLLELAAALACVAVLGWSPHPLVDLAAAAPLVVYLPGRAVLRALDADPEGRLERASVTVALSLALVIVSGLLLNLADSITRQGFLLLLGAIACAASIVALARAPRAAAPAAPEAPRAQRATAWAANLTMATLAVALAGAAVALAVVLNLDRRDFVTTQLWVVPKQGDAEAVVIGLRNAEAGAERYAIEVLVDHSLVQSWSDVPLKPGETWTTTFRWAGLGKYPRPVQPLKEGARGQGAPLATVSERVGLGAAPRVEALVYRSEDRSSVYRRAWTAPQCALGDDTHGRPPCVF
ncbi:hypothetical protein DFR50_12944 [Roseiarcus fermentans]|uniref:DUF1616 domain-containing protein n=1 Tax=Roseiarcus fermentans TaxID=1473586 RepID=A0A366EXN5_9HYPH|nr:hypothetical protein [Roseiarcus fermentans]RBP07114.1 hypothetical protein DFR50_12944 [Roseiarcus fermentans]